MRDRLNRDDIDPDTYAVAETVHEDGHSVGIVSTKRIRDVLEEHPDACRVFRMVSGAGHDATSSRHHNRSAAEHAGRIEDDVASLVDELTDYRRCRVRLDTSAPQLATLANGTGHAQIQFDDSVVRWVPPSETMDDDPA